MKEYNKDKIWKDVYEKKYKYKLTNKDISDNFRDVKFLFTKKDFLAAFSYWVVYQSPYDTPDIQPALEAFKSYIDLLFVGRGIIYLSYDKLLDIINEKKFESILEIEKLNHPKIDIGQTIVFSSRYDQPEADYNFIDLGALARNIRFMLMREYITQ